MEKQPSFALKLSLEEMVLRRIAVLLWKEPDVFATIGKLQSTASDPTWNRSEWIETVECKITNKMAKLNLPESLAKRMMPIIKAVGTEIRVWKSFHDGYLRDPDKDMSVRVFEKLRWTSAGTVDERKTAEELSRSDVVDVVKRFELACLYCLEDCVPVLWKELPEETKKTLCEEPSRVESPDMPLLVPYILERQSGLYVRLSNRISFDYASCFGTKTLAEYCLRKLTAEEREETLVRTTKNVIEFQSSFFPCRNGKLSDVACYLLSLVTREKQMHIFQELPCEVLRCFLDWPWQDLFFDVADVVWPSLPESKYEVLLRKIGEHVDESGYYFPNFFQNLLTRSPVDFRKLFVDEECRSGRFFKRFFDDEDTETIKTIFRNVDASDRVRLASSDNGLELIYNNIPKWHVVEVFLAEARLSNEDKRRLKECFMGLLLEKGGIEGAREIFRRFFEFVEVGDASSQSKRRSEKETSIGVKKFCCEKEDDSTE